MKYNESADAELEKIYASVGATTPLQKYNALHLALGGGSERNFYATPRPVTDEIRQAVLEQEYLLARGLIEVQYH